MNPYSSTYGWLYLFWCNLLLFFVPLMLVVLELVNMILIWNGVTSNLARLLIKLTRWLIADIRLYRLLKERSHRLKGLKRSLKELGLKLLAVESYNLYSFLKIFTLIHIALLLKIVPRLWSFISCRSHSKRILVHPLLLPTFKQNLL